MIFEWDEIKNKSNAGKHGISFEQAIIIFDKPYLRFSSRQVGTEKRECLLGEVAGFGVTLVVITKRDGCIRIISARRASRKERTFYYGNQTSIA